MVHVQLIHMRLIPKSVVVRQLGGACDCWTVQVTILRSNDWNAHLPEVPPAGEEPPPPNGDPHPMFGPEMTAEQLYQQQVHNWFAQNGAPPAMDQPDSNEGDSESEEVQIDAGWGEWPAPPAPQPQLPPYLMNFQSWLAAQGMTVQDGIVPENNISNNPAQAWNDSITVFDDSSNNHTDLALIVFENHEVFDPLNAMEAVQDHMVENISLSVQVHNTGIQFSLSAQGNEVMNFLLANPAPRLQLNTFLTAAIRPILATFGPWRNGYGIRNQHEQLELQISIRTEELCILQLPNTNNAPHSSRQSTVVIQDISESPEAQTAAIQNTETQSTAVLELETNTSEVQSHEIQIAEVHSQVVQVSAADMNDLPGGSAVALPGVLPILVPQPSPNKNSVAASITPPSLLNILEPVHTDASNSKDSGSTMYSISDDTSSDSTALSADLVRKDRKKKPVVVDESTLRRSTRSNKYDGFKAPSMADGRSTKSKVKQRQVPEAPNLSTTTSAAQSSMPPPTPIPMLQMIGTIKCGVPATELSEDNLMADQESSTSSST